MPKSQEMRLITAILPKGEAPDLLRILRKDKNLTTANMNTCRGIGTSTPLGKKGAGRQLEKDVLTVAVPKNQADDIFNLIYEKAKIGRPHGGFIYQTKLSMGTLFELPDLPEEH